MNDCGSQLLRRDSTDVSRETIFNAGHASVSRESFADTELGENDVEYFFHINIAGNASEIL